MTLPVLLCQGFQQGFIDPASPAFSVSASVRRNVCEQILKHARGCGWTTIHCFFDIETADRRATASIDGFAPRPSESYFRQRTLSAFGAPGFAAKFERLSDSAVFLIGLAGLGPIAATFLDGLEHRLPIFVVTDAVADAAHAGVGEDERLAAVDALARAYGRAVRSTDVLRMTGLVWPADKALAVAV